MKLYKFSLTLLALALFVIASPAIAQTGDFSDPNVDYSFSLPDEKWRMTAKPSETGPNVEYVYGERSDGHLEVRKTTIAKNAELSGVMLDEEQKQRFRQGFVAGKDEPFTGKLKGAISNFEFVSGGRSMIGRFYFLRANDTTVYVLRFVGRQDSLRSIRPQTDSIARTFTVK